MIYVKAALETNAYKKQFDKVLQRVLQKFEYENINYNGATTRSASKM